MKAIFRKKVGNIVVSEVKEMPVMTEVILFPVYEPLSPQSVADLWNGTATVGAKMERYIATGEIVNGLRVYEN